MKEEIEVCACEESLSLKKELTEARARVASSEAYRAKASAMLDRVVQAARPLDCGCNRCVSERMMESAECMKDLRAFVKETSLELS